MSITELEVKKKRSKFKFSVKFVLTKHNNKNKTLTNGNIADKHLRKYVFELNKLLNYMIVTEPHHTLNNTSQCVNYQRYNCVHKS